MAYALLMIRIDLFVCQRPVRWFTGVPSPVKEPNKVDMCIFRENSEDIYAGVEYHVLDLAFGSAGAVMWLWVSILWKKRLVQRQ